MLSSDQGSEGQHSLEIENQPAAASEPRPLFWMDVATPDYFHVNNIPIVSGRSFMSADESGNAPVAIVTAGIERTLRSVPWIL
jgi:hypothetical protein